MAQSGRVAIAELVSRGKEQLVWIRPYKKSLVLHTMYRIRVLGMLDEKSKGKEIVIDTAPALRRGGKVVDIMEALKRSMERVQPRESQPPLHEFTRQSFFSLPRRWVNPFVVELPLCVDGVHGPSLILDSKIPCQSNPPHFGLGPIDIGRYSHEQNY